jgi:RNA polymerase sigma-70 factor (ECF subfamily)
VTQGNDDSKLLERVRGGERDAYRILVERYQKRVYNLAYSLLKSREDAADIAQEAFTKAYRSLEGFKGDASFYTWIYRITNNLCIDFLRKAGSASTQVEYSEELPDDPSAETQAGVGVLSSRLGTNPQRSVLRRELAEKLEEALALLPEKHRAILVLREVDGLSYEELAQALEIPKGTVMSRLFHARSKMQELLGIYLEGDSPDSAVNENE